MSVASPSTPQPIKHSPNLTRYYIMWALGAVALVFLVLSFVCVKCTVPFIIAFAIAGTGSIAFHTVLNHVLKPYYKGPFFTRKTIDRHWEAENSTPTPSKATEE